MATQVEPIDLPGLVALLYRADWTRLRLSATVHARHDQALRSRMLQAMAMGQNRAPELGRPPDEN
jgi:hypothetical protein